MNSETDQLRAFLASTDAPCPNCRYNLRGLTSSVCPECNQHLVLRVGLAEGQVGTIIAAASGFLSGAGAALVCLVLVGLFTIRYGAPGRREVFAVYALPVLTLLIEGALAIFLLSLRGRRWVRDDSSRWIVLTAVGWVLTAAAILTFFVSVR